MSTRWAYKHEATLQSGFPKLHWTPGEFRPSGKLAAKVLFELGGWKSPKTVLECYQQADLENQRAMQAGRALPTPPTDTSGPIVATGNAG